MKVLVATEKPFSKAAVDGIRTIVEEAASRQGWMIHKNNTAEYSQDLFCWALLTGINYHKSPSNIVIINLSYYIVIINEVNIKSGFYR